MHVGKATGLGDGGAGRKAVGAAKTYPDTRRTPSPLPESDPVAPRDTRCGGNFRHLPALRGDLSRIPDH